jgi:Ubiquitin family
MIRLAAADRSIRSESRNASLMTQEAFHDIHRKIEMIIDSIEDEKAARFPARPHTELDRSAVPFDPSYKMRHYLDSSCSLLSEITSRIAASMQVSSDSDSTIDNLAIPVIATNTGQAPLSSHIFVEANPPWFETLVLAFQEQQTVKDLKTAIKSKIYLYPESRFALLYRGEHLSNPDATLADFNISHGSTLTLLDIGLRPNTTEPETRSGQHLSDKLDSHDMGETRPCVEDVEHKHMGYSVVENLDEDVENFEWGTNIMPLSFPQPEFSKLRVRKRSELILVLNLSNNSVKVCGAGDILGKIPASREHSTGSAKLFSLSFLEDTSAYSGHFCR